MFMLIRTVISIYCPYIINLQPRNVLNPHGIKSNLASSRGHLLALAFFHNKVISFNTFAIFLYC